MTDAIVEDFLASFDDSRFPAAFLLRYELMECLSNHALGETLLVKDRQTGEHYIAKCYIEDSLPSSTSESDLLRRLDHDGLPAYIAEYQNDRTLCVVREFARGKSLDRLAREAPLAPRQCVDIAAQLCDILSYLHGQTPPVIHRDIKPQNIIVDDSGRVTLIDFGISRRYDETSEVDTLCFGTRYYSAPEQYGFSQTDCRSDIYSLGVLLCWLFTGSVDVQQAKKAIANRRLAHIVAKCTAFNPEDRYQNAASVRAELTGQTLRRRGLLFALGAALVVLFAIFYVAKAAPWQNRPPAGLTFEEPLIEAAVRLTLGKDPSEPLSEEDLLSVNELYIFGDQAAGNNTDFQVYADDFVNQGGSLVQRGSIDTLDDLLKLKNLRNVSLVYQNITSLGPMAELESIESLDLRHNPLLDDVTPLAGTSSLTALILFDTGVSDLTALADCPRLEVVDVGYTQVTSTTALDGLDALTTLVIRKAPLESLENIESHPLLERMYLSETGLTDLSPLLALPRLEMVEVSENLRPAGEAVEEEALFEIIYQ